jgi:predicted metalloprotease
LPTVVLRTQVRTLVGPKSVRPRLVGALAAGAAVATLAGCSTTLQGSPVSVYADPFKVAGMQAVDGPTGLREGISRDARKVQNTDDGRIDEISAQSVSDIEEYWADAFGEAFEGDFRPVDAIVSWDADGYAGNFCGEFTAGLVNAAFCPVDNTIGWDRGVLFPALRNAHGDMAITMVLAHEYGHSVQRQARLNRRQVSTLVAEQQADCFSGAYMRWVAEDNSTTFWSA